MIRRRTASWTLTVVAALTPATGCTSNPTDKDAPLPARPLAEVTQQAQADANIIVQAATAAEMILWSSNPTPCMGRNGEFADDDRWYLSAGFNLKVASADQFSTIGRIKAALEQQAWELTAESSFAGGARGRLSARNPATGHTVELFTTKSLTHIAVSLDSPCYMPAPGENPLRG